MFTFVRLHVYHVWLIVDEVKYDIIHMSKHFYEVRQNIVGVTNLNINFIKHLI